MGINLSPPMKPARIPSAIIRPALLLTLLAGMAAPALAGWSSTPIENNRQVFELADVDRNGNIDPAERDRLRTIFAARTDLEFIDKNRNRRLEREEIDAVEIEVKAAERKKREEQKIKEEREKEERKKKKKKNRP